jgi:hypothetical protein
VLKKWVDPRTASKLVIVTQNDVLPTLTESIDLVCIPEQFGGKLQFQHGSLPKLDATLSTALEWTSESTRTLPAGPIKWSTNQEGGRMAVAVGRVNGETRDQHIAMLKH